MKREQTRSTGGAIYGRLWVLGLMVVLCIGMFNVSSAGAAYTHLYKKQITLASGTEPQPAGVDSEGNIIVFLVGQEVIAKYDDEGNPVNFSALGTNIIDGTGGLECATVPADCDRVPAGGFGPLYPNRNMVVVDNSGGPTDGYIYFRNQNTVTKTGEVDVFAPSGAFLGTINEAQALPWSDPNTPAASLSIAPNGTLYIGRAWEQLGYEGQGGGHIDEYAPVDGNPAHDQFVGQLRFQVQWPVKQVNFVPANTIGLGNGGAYVMGNAIPEIGLGSWRRYGFNEFLKPQANDLSLPVDGFPFDRDNDNLSDANGAINSNTNWVYLLGGSGISVYDEMGHEKIGPTIPSEGHISAGATTLAFDDSGGTNDGDVYVQGGTDKLTVFGPPVVIPDITVEAPEADHKSAVVHVSISKAGGPDVSECVVEYGITNGYGSEVPCNPAPVYGSDTEVSAELPGLFTETDYHYRVKAGNANGWNRTYDNVVHTVAVLDVQTGGVSNITSTTATLNGSLKPDGIETEYKFQYGIDKNYDLQTALVDAGAGTGTLSVDSGQLTKLQPGRIYHYRLVAQNELGTTFGEDRTFTVPAKPLVASVNPSAILGTSVNLHAHINDYDLDADYYFEYGTTETYGSATPIESLPADPSAQAVMAHLQGLDPNSTYHFRVVATNEFGTTKSADATFDYRPPACPNSHVRQQVGANYLPDCRAYELVSPTRAGSIQLFPGDFFFRLESTYLTGDKYAPRYVNSGYESSPARFGFYGGIGGLAGTESPNFLFDRYLSTRTPEGWVTHYTGLKSSESGVTFRGRCSVTQDKCIDYKSDVFLNKETGNFEIGAAPFPYVWSADGKFLERWPTNFAVVPEADHLTGDERPSPDFEHFVFSSLDLAFAPGGLTSAPGSVYDNAVGPGTIDIVSRLDNGDPIPQDAGAAGEFIKVPAVSRDGSHILMSTLAANGGVNLYMRVDDAITYEVSTGVGVEYIGMAGDGSSVEFSSPEALTGEDTDTSRDIYIWEEATEQVRLVSVGPNAGNTDDCNASWTEKCSIKLVSTTRPDLDDKMAAGGDVYFYSPEQLDPDNPGVANQQNLYHLHNGAVQYVTTLDPGTTTSRFQVSADGQHAAFVTKSTLTGYDNSYYDKSGSLRKAAEMYVFDAARQELQCASCDPEGGPITTIRSDPPGNEFGGSSADVLASNNGRFITDDGRVAFATAEPLSPRDTDGIVDVYEFVGGRPQLIGAGTGDRDTLPKLAIFYPGQVVGLESFSRDGKDLYFSTFDVLVPQDHNGPFVKFYDARTGGGFATPGELLPCEAADECHGDTSSSPSNPQVGTGTPYTVSGSAEEPAHRKHRRNRRNHRRRKQHRHPSTHSKRQGARGHNG